MSFDLPLTAFALESAGTPLPLGAAQTLTLPLGLDDGSAQAPGVAAAQPLRASALYGETPPPVTLTL